MTSPTSEKADEVATSREKLKDGAVELIKFVLGAAAVYLFIITFVFRTFFIPSASMQPTLEVHDRVFVLNFLNGWSRFSLPLFQLSEMLPKGDGRILGGLPKRGAVVVFADPDRRKRQHLIKRVIGLPGDVIQLRDGRLYINDELVPRDEKGRVRYRDYRGVIQEATLYEETLPGGKKHMIYERSDAEPVDDTEPITVRRHHVFVMGDNRDESNDSRVIGLIPAERLVGPAITVFFTFADCNKKDARANDLQCPKGRLFRPL